MANKSILPIIDPSTITVIHNSELTPKTMVVSTDIWDSMCNVNKTTIESTDEEAIKTMLEHP